VLNDKIYFTAPSSRLLVPSSPQVWRQSAQVDHNHLGVGMPLDPVDHVVDTGDEVERFFPT
jgi:hypothetical protein